ncbi:MAG: ATP-binding cassette domain-containing protein [Muribaculaceae bacterium]|nr:ATP-binding cassette domain-containing protein [Muribaculaceae bacterium]
MKEITLHNTLPRVFAGQNNISSDVWHRDITFEKGKQYLISAESGTGKSSLCSYIYGYRQDYSGTIAFDGVDIKSLTVQQWCNVRQHHIAYLPQDMRLFGELTAMENVELKNRLTGFKSRDEITHLFEAMGIADKVDSLASKLSIGQQQRVAIIRTLCQPCDFILLDEPVSHLDDENNRTVARLITEEATRQGAGVIATSVGYHLKMDAITFKL